MTDVYLPLLASVFALVYAGIVSNKVLGKSIGNEKMKKLCDKIKDGAMTFLKKEYEVLVIFIVIITAIIAVMLSVEKAAAFVVGAIFSALAGNIGMRIATSSNSRTTEACRHDIAQGLDIAFSSGLTMGLAVVGLGVLGITVLFMIFGNPDILYGFGFGASSIALFARVGGGIFTKAADVGADLVGKVEAGIPEDDPRNPAVIADNVGDNVGDVAGMGADLFESYVDSIIATMAIAAVGLTAFNTPAILLPLAIASIGIIASIIGSLFVKVKDPGKIHGVLDKGTIVASVLVAVLSFVYLTSFLGEVTIAGETLTGMSLFIAMLSGLLSGLAIGFATEYYTSDHKPPVQQIAESAQQGAAIDIITGLSIGMKSTIVPVLAVCAAILVAYEAAGIYGIGIAAVGMLSTLGVTLAADSYGPVADNAAGIAEMAGLEHEVRERAEQLDAVGNTTAAIGKGFAIGSAALTSLALFTAYVQETGLTAAGINIVSAPVMVGLFIGGLLPFVFSSYSMMAVGNAAADMVEEVRKQFKEIKGLMEGKAEADSARCVEISTHAAIREMILPGLLAVFTPIVVGLILGPEALGGLLAGSIVTGFLMAVLMANAGGAWDNAKKYIEAGNYGGKGSPAHANAVVGDTVGDPFKDTSGPSLNILIKLVSIVALVVAPLIV